MTSLPALWIIAGPNGAGKTTCAQKEPILRLLPGVQFYNPDNVTLNKLQARGYQGFRDAPVEVQTELFIQSADEVFDELRDALARKQSVGVETVLSSNKYRPLVDSVLAENGMVNLIYVALSSATIAQERVAARVRRGGHGVPEKKIAARWARSLQNLPWFAKRSWAYWVIDNSDSDPTRPPVLIASGTFGFLEYLNESAFPELKDALRSLPTR